MTTLAEKRPGPEWTRAPWPTHPAPANASAWQYGPLFVLSELVVAEYPDGAGVGPQWLVSISASGKRPKPKQVRKALRAFGMVGAELDTHHPGVAVDYWRPVDPAHRVDCQCKADEATVREPDGYTWTTPADGDCRGCELEQLTGAPCPTHTGASPNTTSRARQLGRLLP